MTPSLLIAETSRLSRAGRHRHPRRIGLIVAAMIVGGLAVMVMAAAHIF